MNVKQALFYNIVSSVLSFIGTYIGLWLGNFSFATQWIYAITAGSFIYIALADLVSVYSILVIFKQKYEKPMPKNSVTRNTPFNIHPYTDLPLQLLSKNINF